MAQPRVSHLKVLIAGAGLGGLTLALLLEQAGIEYTILEKHEGDLIPLGSSISLNQSIQPLFEQLGMLKELESISKPINSMTFLKENMNKIGSLDLSSDAVRYVSFVGILEGVLSLVWRMIKKDRAGVSYEADILVGADGAYSCVRRCLYRDLRSENLLPKSDMAPLAFDHHCLVGITDPIDPIYFPDLSRSTCDMMVVIGKDKPYSSVLFFNSFSTR
ncbi:hypothetical protein KI688_004115 [Linnemannia hyalina]|uniref:FAD-binding domain-containing protein n=1 Tax=Linnemannia hyalina TaxID=64524 RepID=A0A9P8BQJ6_9FUNG|nr:hypothetical protein KI688_004115 [Linnemannia hyalina]